MSAISKSVRLSMLKAEIKAAGPAAQAIFKQCLKNGSTMEFAAMCAMRQAPGSKNTDRAFCQGAERQTRMMAPVNRKVIYERAKKAGISTQGKWYKGSLGRADDPAAWVSSADDVMAVAKEKNLSISGVVNYTSTQRDVKPKPKVRLAKDLVDLRVKEVLRENPDLAAKVKERPKSLQDVVQSVIEKHGSKRK